MELVELGGTPESSNPWRGWNQQVRLPKAMFWTWKKKEAFFFWGAFSSLFRGYAVKLGVTVFMAGQPTPPNVPPPEIRPYDQGLLTIGFP